MDNKIDTLDDTIDVFSVFADCYNDRKLTAGKARKLGNIHAYNTMNIAYAMTAADVLNDEKEVNNNASRLETLKTEMEVYNNKIKNREKGHKRLIAAVIGGVLFGGAIIDKAGQWLFHYKVPEKTVFYILAPVIAVGVAKVAYGMYRTAKTVNEITNAPEYKEYNVLSNADEIVTDKKRTLGVIEQIMTNFETENNMPISKKVGFALPAKP